MNLVQLRYVKVVARAASFSAAARECCVSQPTISNAISDLEEEWGAKLFKRTTRRVELTSFGRYIVDYIEGVLSSVNDLDQQAGTFLNPQGKLLRIAFSPLIDSSRLMKLFEPFRRVHPDVEILYKECSVDDMETRLDTEKVDVVCGIRLREASSRRRCVLYRDALRYLPRGGLEKYNGLQTIAPAEIVARDALILTVGTCGLAPATRELFQRSKLKLREYPGQALSYHALQEWTHHGIAAAILPESRITGNAEAYPIVVANQKPVMIAYEAVWDQSASLPTQVQTFSRYLKAAIGVSQITSVGTANSNNLSVKITGKLGNIGGNTIAPAP